MLPLFGQGWKQTEPWYLAAGVKPIIAYQPKGATNLTASYVNLVNPGTYNAALGGAPTWNVLTGWYFGDGSNSWLDTTYTMPSVVEQPMAIMVRYSDYDLNASGSGTLFGGKTGSEPYFAIQIGSPTVYSCCQGQYNTVNEAFPATGTACITGQALYLNGSVKSSSIPKSAANTWGPLYVAKQQEGTYYSKVKIQAWAYFNVTLSSTQVAALSSAMAAIPDPVPLIYDTFTGTDGTTLPDHTPNINTPGNPWIALSGTWTIQSGKAVKTNAANYNYAVIDTGKADCVIRVKVYGTTNYRGLALRMPSAGSGYIVCLTTVGFTLFEVPSFTDCGSRAVSIPEGSELVVTLSGANITITVAGTTLNYASATLNQTATKHGIMIYDPADSLDEFKVFS